MTAFQKERTGGEQWEVGKRMEKQSEVAVLYSFLF